MIEGPIFVTNTRLENEADRNSIQDPCKVNQGPLPDELLGISSFVLLADTTFSDNLDDIIIPPIPTGGQIMYHDKEGVEYKESSQHLFDNAHKFNDLLNPPTITLQFRLGLEDDGTSMDDLLLKANVLNDLGYFKFKLYIFKIVSHQKRDKFRMPPLCYFKKLKCIGFRFDTDIIPFEDNYFSEVDLKTYYLRNVNHHIPITLGWLGEELEELHLGQKVRITKLDFIHLRFPRLRIVGVECYDLVTTHNFKFFLLEHNTSIKELTLRDMNFDFCSEMTGLAKITLIAQNEIKDSNLRHLPWVKEFHIYGLKLHLSDQFCLQNKNNRELHYSINENVHHHSLKKFYEGVEKLSSWSFNIVEEPFIPSHQQALKWRYFKSVLEFDEGNSRNFFYMYNY